MQIFKIYNFIVGLPVPSWNYHYSQENEHIHYSPKFPQAPLLSFLLPFLFPSHPGNLWLFSVMTYSFLFPRMLHQCNYSICTQSLSRVRLFVTPMDCNLPGSSVHGIFQARILEQVAISYSRGSSQIQADSSPEKPVIMVYKLLCLPYFTKPNYTITHPCCRVHNLFIPFLFIAEL